MSIANGFVISTNKEYLDIDVIYQYLHDESYWAKGIPRSIVEESIANSVCFGVYEEKDGVYKQVGFARMVTDLATFAYIADVFILTEFRKLGLSKALVQTMLDYPGIKDVRKILLGTRDAHGLYRQFGFKEVENKQLYMENKRKQYE